jgi:RNA polymerase sigma-70 factor (ECF subfamily)
VTLDRFAEMAASAEAVERVEDWPADFYLACAASNGDRRAIAAIERDCLIPSTPRLRRLGASADEIQDALQATRERLFVGPTAKIGSYGATAPLKQWVQLVAIRITIDLRRSGHAEREVFGSETLAGAIDSVCDPATSLLKETYRSEFEKALKAQIASLPARDRAILKLHLLEGVSVEKIAMMRSVHRVTVARWIWKASEAMLDGVRQYFLTQHGLIPGECDSLVNLVRSRLSLDWARLFDSNH